MRYIIQGAGAIGSAIGGSLAKAGFDVTLIARKPHVEAIKKQNGILLHTLKGTMLQPVKAAESIAETEISEDSVIFQTMKANDTEDSLKDLAGIDRDTPIVCFQNGVENESIISGAFNRVYGAVVRFTATMMTPGETRFAGTGKLILGAFPEGLDAPIDCIVEDISHTPFTVLKSTNILQDKWLKLLVNLISCIKPMVKNPSRNIEKRIEICRHALAEGIAVLAKAGITAASTNGTEDSPEKMMSNFDSALALAEGVGQGMELQNSTWQTLAKHRKILENDLYTGTIITLGEKHGMPTPYNKAILFYLHDIANRELGPESIAVDDILNLAKKLV